LNYFYAKANDNSNWTIIIKDSAQQTVRTFAESGKKIRQAWDGKDQSGQPLAAGSYSYQIQAQRQSDLSEATPLLGMISIGTDYPISFISSPLVGGCIAKQVYIFGSANDPDFKQYKLEYGLGAVPSAWTQIKQSSMPVASGYLGAVDLSSLEIPYVTFRLTVDDNSSHTAICTCIIAFSLYQVTTSPNPFSPNNDGKRDTTTISAQFSLESNWTLVIKDPTGQNLIRTWTGSGNTMSQLWDGKNESGEIQNDGIYPFLLTVSNASLPEPDIVNGALMLDQTYPIAQITDPTEGELFSNVYGGSFLTDIFGTAADDNFVNYKLEYGETSNPTSWNLIGEYGSPITNNKLGELNNSLLTNGEYTIRLRVLDVADNESSAVVHIHVGHLKLLLSSRQLNIAQSENVIVTTEVPFDATETIVIKDKNAAIVKTLVDNLLRNGGTYNDPWDGKDNSGTNLLQGAYYVVVSIVVAQDQKYFLLDLTNTGGVKRPPEGGDPTIPPFNFTYPSSFSPYKGEMATFTFDLDEPSLVELFAREGLENGRTRNLLVMEPLASGFFTVHWDGTDDNGTYLDKALSGLDNYIIFWAYTLPANAVVVYGEKPEVTALSANPIYFFPAAEDLPNGLEISYSISRSSDVIILIQDGQGHNVKTMNLGAQSAGAHQVFWNGRAADGQLADSGSYRIGVSLTDPLGNNSLIRYCPIIVFY
jgi:flagellar hook assembly protein FlgD